MTPIRPSQFAKVDPDKYPLTVELLDAETRQVRWKAIVHNPYTLLTVPSRNLINEGRPCASRVTYADGEVEEVDP